MIVCAVSLRLRRAISTSRRSMSAVGVEQRLVLQGLELVGDLPRVGGHVGAKVAEQLEYADPRRRARRLTAQCGGQLRAQDRMLWRGLARRTQHPATTEHVGTTTGTDRTRVGRAFRNHFAGCGCPAGASRTR
jgi:hypothetical protein